MSERLSRGARKHNREEKAAARRQGRAPFLLMHQVQKHAISEPNPAFGRQISQVTNEAAIIKEPITTKIFPMSRAERYVPLERRRDATIDEIMSAGMRLSAFCRGIGVRPNDLEYLSDQQAVQILDELTLRIRAGDVTTREVVATQVHRLGPLIGVLGSASTEIDIAALNVIDALVANKKRFQ